jgi:hypothetical protein
MKKFHSPASVDIQKLLQLNGETCLLGIHHDKDIPLPKPQLLP